MGLFLKEIWLELTIGLSVLLFIIYTFWKRPYSYWKELGVPHVESSFPFGNTRDVVLNRRFKGLVFKDLYFKLKGHRYGGIVDIRRPDLILRDPEVIKLMLTKDFNHFTHRGRTFDEEKDTLLAHLINLSGDRWRLLRTKLSPTFTSGKMRMMFSLVKACGHELQKSLEEHADKTNVVELKDYMARFGIDVIGSCAFGLEIDSINNPDSDFRKVSEDIFIPSLCVTIRDNINSIMPGLSKFIRVKTFPKARDEFFFRIIGDTIKYRTENNVKRNDFLDLLIEIMNKDKLANESCNKKENGVKYTNQNGGKINKLNDANDFILTNELAAAQCFVFFIAGFETSSTTLSCCLYELALNKPIQQLLQDEIDTVLAKHNGQISCDALTDMTYMDRVVQESLRKYSPVGVLNRECVDDYKLPGSNLVIKKGQQIVVPLYGIHYDPEYYPDPDQFDPDRFTEEAKQSRPQYTWLPFGEGPRSCIGMRFGIMQVKTGLVYLLSKYNFYRAPETQVPLELNADLLAAPAKGIKLKISKRA